MNLRNRLLVSSISIAMVVVVIFGTVAYHIALDSATTNEITLIRNFALDKAQQFSSRLADDKTARHLRQLLVTESGNNYVTVAVDTAGNVLSSRPLEDVLGKYHEDFQPLELVRNKNGSDLTINNKRYHWSAAAIPETPYTLVLLHRNLADISETPAYETLGLRLLITGVIIIWVAVWGGLVLAEITSKRLNEQNAKMLHQSLHDSLTGLPNRTLFNDRLQQAIYYSQRDNKPITLFVVDLDSFKEINDTLGHKSGDTLLEQVGSRLHDAIWDRDTIARLGGDEFAVLLTEVGIDQVPYCAGKVTKALDKPFTINNLNLQIGASIGIAIYPEHGHDPETLIRHADVAMYQAKQDNREFVVYTPDSDPHNMRRLTLMSELRQAIEQDELILYFQPKIDIVTRRAVGVEALVRWQHPQHGFVQPNDFIPLAEQTGLIKPLTHWVIKETLRQYCAWRRKGIILSIAVNISVRSLRDQQLLELITELLEKNNAPPSCLNLEITESAVMTDPERVKIILRELHAMGVRVSIDDFGTGYTSLSYLKELPIDEIKIDKSFVINMIHEDNDAVIVRSVIELARNMGYRTVAEGVESKDAWDILEILECDTAQGNYMAKPLPAPELERWLAESTWGLIEDGKVTSISAAIRSGKGKNRK